MGGADVPCRGLNLGQGLCNANSKFDVGHGQVFLPDFTPELVRDSPETLAAPPPRRRADDNIETGRDTIPVVAGFRVAARKNWVAAGDRACDLAWSARPSGRRGFLRGS